MVHSPSIDSLPPSVVYIHGLTSAVEVFFKNTGQRFGYLRLAGHQAAPGGQERCQDPCGYCEVREDLENALEDAWNNLERMDCESPDGEQKCYPYEVDPDSTVPDTRPTDATPRSF